MSACSYPCLNNGQNSERNITWWCREYNRITTQNHILQDTCLTSCTVRERGPGWRSRYGLDGLRIESRWGDQVFRTRPNRPWGPRSHLYNGCRVSFPGVKRPGSGVDHLSPPRAQIKERVEVSTFSLDLRALLYGELHLHLTVRDIAQQRLSYVLHTDRSYRRGPVTQCQHSID